MAYKKFFNTICSFIACKFPDLQYCYAVFSLTNMSNEDNV